MELEPKQTAEAMLKDFDFHRAEIWFNDLIMPIEFRHVMDVLPNIHPNFTADEFEAVDISYSFGSEYLFCLQPSEQFDLGWSKVLECLQHYDAEFLLNGTTGICKSEIGNIWIPAIEQMLRSCRTIKKSLWTVIPPEALNENFDAYGIDLLHSKFQLLLDSHETERAMQEVRFGNDEKFPFAVLHLEAYRLMLYAISGDRHYLRFHT